MQKFEKNTARHSLPSASQLPIIVPMKIWFRTRDEQGGEQSVRQHSSANPTSPKSPWSPQRPVSSDTWPAKNPPDHSLRITVISNRELLVLENLQLIENKNRRPVLIENFEPNSSPSFRHFLHRGPKASRAAFPFVENPRNHFNPQGAD
jgi:hypothetical protein